MDSLYSSNAEDAERIRAMILFDDVSNDDSIDDATESDDSYVEWRESISECAEHGSSDDYSSTEVDATENCCHWKRQDEVRQGKMFYTHSTQMAKCSYKITRRY
jgi:hypothetical protein